MYVTCVFVCPPTAAAFEERERIKNSIVLICRCNCTQYCLWVVTLAYRLLCTFAVRMLLPSASLMQLYCCCYIFLASGKQLLQKKSVNGADDGIRESTDGQTE